MNPYDLENLSKEGLIKVILNQAEQLTWLQADYQQMKAN